MQSVPPGKHMSKLTKRAKAALDEQREILTKHKASVMVTSFISSSYLIAHVYLI